MAIDHIDDISFFVVENKWPAKLLIEKSSTFESGSWYLSIDFDNSTYVSC